MSSTRKIEGWLSKDAFTDPSNKGCAFCMEMRPLLCDMSATLIIGKGYTEEEVNALLRRIASECHTWRDATPILLEYGLEPLNP